jgi:hypothetical protein
LGVTLWHYCTVSYRKAFAIETTISITFIADLA